jgi:hypothetical protein
MTMKFSDIFLPKLARSDPEERKKGVLKEKNPAVLKQVIQKDSNPEVRKLAKQQLQKLAV